MGDDKLVSRKRGLGGLGFGDFSRNPAPRCIRTVDLEAHHVITTAGSGIDNIQMLCHECHKSTETHGKPSGISPSPFPEFVKALAKTRCGGRCECVRVHAGHGYIPEVPTLLRR